MRRPFAGANRRSGFRGIGGSGGGAVPYTPASDPLNLISWDGVAPGAVASWTDTIASVALTQATGSRQPTASATAIGGAYPGVSSDGTDVLIAPSTAFAGLGAITIICAMTDAITTACIAMELTVDANSNNGAFFISPNTGAAGRLTISVRGTVGVTTAYITDPLTTPRLVSVGISFATAGAGAVAFVRINGVAQSLTTTATSSAAGVAANASLHLFGRGATATVPWNTGVFGQRIIIRSGVTQDAALLAAERYVGAGIGVIV